MVPFTKTCAYKLTPDIALGDLGGAFPNVGSIPTTLPFGALVAKVPSRCGPRFQSVTKAAIYKQLTPLIGINSASAITSSFIIRIFTTIIGFTASSLRHPHHHDRL